MHCDAERGKAASGTAATAFAFDESKRLASRTADALLRWSKSRMLGAAGKGPLPQHRRSAFAADVPSMAAIR
jgi:hypothetical protein